MHQPMPQQYSQLSGSHNPCTVGSMTPSQGTSAVQRVASQPVASQPAKMADKDVAAADTTSGMTAGSTAGKGKRKSQPVLHR